MDHSLVMLRVNKETNHTLKKTHLLGLLHVSAIPDCLIPTSKLISPITLLSSLSSPYPYLMRKGSIINPVLQVGTCGTEVKCHAEGCLNQSRGWMPTLPLKSSTLPAMLPFSWSCDSIIFLFINFPLVNL